MRGDVQDCGCQASRRYVCPPHQIAALESRLDASRAECAQLREALAVAEKERDEARRSAGDHEAAFHRLNEDAATTVRGLEAREAKLREALAERIEKGECSAACSSFPGRGCNDYCWKPAARALTQTTSTEGADLRGTKGESRG